MHVTSKLFSLQNSIKVQFNSYIIEHYGKIYIGPGVTSTEVLFPMGEDNMYRILSS